MRPVLVSNVSETNNVAEKESGQGPIRARLTGHLVLQCLLLTGTACLTLYCNRAFCSNQPAEIPAGSISAAQNAPMAGLTKRPVTGVDSIRMKRLGDPYYTNGGPSKGIVAKFSADGKHFVVVLKKGNLEANTNEYSLVLFQTTEVFQSPEPQVLVSLASSSNRPAISDVLWLDHNDTILFLGERPGEQTQLCSLKVSSKELTKLTSCPTNLTSFVATAGGEVTIYASESPVSTFLTESVARQGMAVTNESVADLIRGSYGGEDGDHSLCIKRLGKDSETKIATQGRIWDDPPPSLSPHGAYLSRIGRFPPGCTRSA
jgi:hypothetical protein